MARKQGLNLMDQWRLLKEIEGMMVFWGNGYGKYMAPLGLLIQSFGLLGEFVLNLARRTSRFLLKALTKSWPFCVSKHGKVKV